jgi:hypothetical protein
VPPTAALDARLDRQVEAEVRIREQEDPNDVAHARNLPVVHRRGKGPPPRHGSRFPTQGRRRAGSFVDASDALFRHPPT